MLHSPLKKDRKEQARAFYQEIDLMSRVEAADPYTLVKILYEELENSLRVLKAAVARNQDIIGHADAHRAHSIIIALLSGLTATPDSNLTNTLADVYHAMAGTIRILVSTGDDEKLDELLDAVVSLRSAWNQISPAS